MSQIILQQTDKRYAVYQLPGDQRYYESEVVLENGVYVLHDPPTAVPEGTRFYLTRIDLKDWP